MQSKENEDRNACDIESQLDRIESIVPMHVVSPLEMLVGKLLSSDFVEDAFSDENDLLMFNLHSVVLDLHLILSPDNIIPSENCQRDHTNARSSRQSVENVT